MVILKVETVLRLQRILVLVWSSGEAPKMIGKTGQTTQIVGREVHGYVCEQNT